MPWSNKESEPWGVSFGGGPEGKGFRGGCQKQVQDMQ